MASGNHDARRTTHDAGEGSTTTTPPAGAGAAAAEPDFELEVQDDPQPARPTAEPDEGPESPPRQLSKCEQLRDYLEGLKWRWRPDHTEVYGFATTRKDCDVRIGRALAFVAELHSCDEAKARELIIKAAVLYLHDDWPGRMDKMPPWHYGALFKYSKDDGFPKLAAYTKKAAAMEWKNSNGIDAWEPA